MASIPTAKEALLSSLERTLPEGLLTLIGDCIEGAIAEGHEYTGIPLAMTQESYSRTARYLKALGYTCQWPIIDYPSLLSFTEETSETTRKGTLYIEWIG